VVASLAVCGEEGDHSARGVIMELSGAGAPCDRGSMLYSTSMSASSTIIIG
jgi:hypothetical protein